MLAQTLSRIRRNHGLEHATIHVLSEKFKNFSAQGHSNHTGFNLNIYGNLTEADVTAAVEEAYGRMLKGEHNLAVHPNCGTVLVTTATMTTIAAQATLAIEQKRQRQNTLSPNVIFNAMPSAILAVLVALIISKPLGIYLQANYTVEGDLGEMKLLSIREVQPSIVTRIFRMLLTGNQLQAKSFAIKTVG